MFHVPNQYRLRSGAYGNEDDAGNNGAFIIRTAQGALRCIASNGEDLEHVSVSRRDRCPVWEEMALIKDLFWDEEDTVMQLHPPKSLYVNCHPYCLHLWRPISVLIPLSDLSPV